MSVMETVILAVTAGLPVVTIIWVFYAPRNGTRDPQTPGWRVVSRQFGREIRTNAMSKDRALRLASRLIFQSVKVLRLDNDAAGTTMTLAQIRADMEHHTKDA